MFVQVSKIVGFKKVTIGFFIVLLIIAANAAFSIFSLQKNREKISKTINILTPYVETMERFNLMVTQSKMLTTNWVYLQANHSDKKNLIHMHKIDYPVIKKELLNFSEQLGQNHDSKVIDSILMQFENLLAIEKEIMQTLTSFEDYEDPLTKFTAEAAIEEEVLPRSETIFRDLGSVISHKREQMNTLKDSMISSFNHLVFSAVITSAIIFLLVFLAGLFIRKSIIQPVIKMNGVIYKLGRGEIPESQLSVSDDAIGDMSDSVNTLSESFKTTSIFANQIGSGNLRAEYEPLSANDLLGNALINMRENLRTYSENLEQKVEERTIELQVEKEKVDIINRELEKLSIVARETDNAIIIADRNGEIEWVNTGFVKLFGYTLEEFKLTFGSSLVDSSNDASISEKLISSIENKTPVIYEVENHTKNGKKLWIQSTLTPVLDGNGNVHKIVVIDSDITARKEAEMVVVQQNKEILDSIHYAKRIQHAILPTFRDIKKDFSNFFVFFRPKDIVSGDFYWHHKLQLKNSDNTIDNKYVFAVVDCTGHGVPGAFMSMIGNNILNTVVIEENITDAGAILSRMNYYTRKALHQDGNHREESKDGMDIVIIVVDPQTMSFQYAGANRPLYLVRPLNEGDRSERSENPKFIVGNNSFLEELKIDRKPIGGTTEYDYQFTSQTFQIEKGLTVYLTSDGFCDQFGGDRGKKFMSGPFKQMLCNLHEMNMNEQLEQIQDKFDSWKGESFQVDDVLIAGIQLDHIVVPKQKRIAQMFTEIR